MTRLPVLLLLALVAVGAGTAGAAQRSRSVGLPWSGSLAGGVELRAQDEHHFTWDDVRKRSPNRGWRRNGNPRLVRVLERVVGEYAAAHPDAPRVGIGDLSRPNGGQFGSRFGGVGHASHQNGLDADVYYPRRDRRERPPLTPDQVDRRLAQDLVDRFVAAGAAKVFVGARSGLRGPPAIVEPLPSYHENHMHVRLPGDGVRSELAGKSTLGAEIRAFALGSGRPRTLVVGCVHGDACPGGVVATRLLHGNRPRRGSVWVVPDLNPDGHAARRRGNARGVDLSRNFPGSWRPLAGAGAEAGSEAETDVAMRLIRRLRPDVTIWFGRSRGSVGAQGASVAVARRYSRLAGMRLRRMAPGPGSAIAWQHGALPGTRSFVVELGPAPLGIRTAQPYASAIVRLNG